MVWGLDNMRHVPAQMSVSDLASGNASHCDVIQRGKRNEEAKGNLCH